jgi:hypothetical protein
MLELLALLNGLSERGHDDKAKNYSKKINRTRPTCPRRPTLSGLDNSGLEAIGHDGRCDCEHHGLICLCPGLCPPPNPTECDGLSLYRWKALLDKAPIAIRHNWSHSV